MNRTVYDLSMLAALGLIGAGTGLTWGLGAGLLAGGVALRRLTGLNQKSLPGLRSSSVRIRLVNISGPL
jgi:hypothetical protein